MRRALLAAASLLTSGCFLAPGMQMDAGQAMSRARDTTGNRHLDVRTIDAGVIRKLAEEAALPPQQRLEDPLMSVARTYRYTIAPYDVLQVIVWDHPELTAPTGQFRSPEENGNAVDADGSVFYPYVGTLEVAGKTVSEVRRMITERLTRVVPNPQVDVKVAAFRGKRVQVTGEVTAPSTIAITDVPMRVQDALAASKGFTPEADFARVTLSRRGQVFSLDLQSLYEGGDQTQNWLLQDGDVVHVPDRSRNKVFVLGEVKQPQSRLMTRGRMTLAEALIDAPTGGFDPLASDVAHIFVIRGDYQAPSIYRLDASSPDALLLASQFPLRPRDVVFVSTYGLTRWDRVIRQNPPHRPDRLADLRPGRPRHPEPAMSPYARALEALQAAPRRWWVTGGCGFIGSHLVEVLLRHGQVVTVLDDLSTGKLENLAAARDAAGPGAVERLTFIRGDVRDPEACAAAAAGARVVLHQAALGSVPRSIENPLATHGVNVTGFLQVLETARAAGVRRVIYASSSAVYGDAPGLPRMEETLGSPLSPYAASKRCDELYAAAYARCYGLEPIGLRYFNVFGPRQDPQSAYAAVMPRWFAGLLRGEPVPLHGDGQTTRDFCYVANVVQANLLAATTAEAGAVGQVLNIGAGGQTTLLRLFQLIRDQVARFRPDAAGAEPRRGPFRAGDVRHSLADVGRARALLGYVPTHGVEQGLAETAPWYAATLGGWTAGVEASP
ncbi:MAG: NAD-dependent epimerase/dehydratase family protein [Anaeromyxobacter sp.]